MKYRFFIYISILLILVFKNSKSNADVAEIDSWQDEKIERLVFDDFELIEGVEIGDINFWQELISESYSRRRVFQLCNGSTKGRARINFNEPTGRYDMIFYYVEGKQADSKVNIYINGQKTGTIEYGTSHSFREKTFTGLNIERWSRIELEFSGEKGAKCRVEKLVLIPAGKFEGKLINPVRQNTLKLFETLSEKSAGRQIFSDYVMSRVDSANKRRKAELEKIRLSREKEPLEHETRWQDAGIAKWKARQEKVRNDLSKYFGKFPERTPLNPQVVGKIEREEYIIEKVIFESQPKFFVTANLYIPKGREFPLPGVVFPLGHSDIGKSRDNYHMSGLGLVLKGYVVLVFDPIGQGERSEYLDQNKNWLVHVGVDQHWYVGRPAFLTDFTLSGLRTWDGIRAVDYLVSRPEVDQNKLAAVGCSGGGQMAMLIAAVDERIKVCAASHPGGPMENAYLTGRRLIDREIYSLVPPRPLRIIVGIESGEEPRHREYLEDMQQFYEGLRVGRNTAELDVVPGPHSMNRSNRESAYEWLNKWFDKEAEGKAEAVLRPEKEEDLWCTESGNTVISLGSETGQTLNARRAEQIYKPEKDLSKLKERISARIGLSWSPDMTPPHAKLFDSFHLQDFAIGKMTFESEQGIIVPALLIKPMKIQSNAPVYIMASEKGKPGWPEESNMAFMLAKNGNIVLAIDVRGTGETSPTLEFSSNQYTGYTPLLRTHDDLAIQCGEFGKTTLGMRSFDMLRAVDLVKSMKDLKNRKIIVAGEGVGGLWALLAAAYDPRIEGVVTIGTLPSYKLLVNAKYYNKVWGYFWVPGALRDFDIPDLSRLISNKKQVWIDPINALGEKTPVNQASFILNQSGNAKIILTEDYQGKDFVHALTELTH